MQAVVPKHLEIREVSCDECWRRIEPLVALHYDEIAKFKDIWKLKPDMAKYQEMESKGRLVCLVAFADDECVGYSVNFLTNNLHYAETLIAQNDLLYVIPERRNSLLGIRLMRETIAVVKDRGARLMVWHSKPNTSLHSIMPRQGYSVLDVLWAKEI